LDLQEVIDQKMTILKKSHFRGFNIDVFGNLGGWSVPKGMGFGTAFSMINTGDFRMTLNLSISGSGDYRGGGHRLGQVLTSIL